MTWLAALALLGAVQASPMEYPFVPFTEPEAAKAVATLERRFAKKNGMAVAVRAVCPSSWEDESYELERIVARQFLVTHFEQAFPLLLEIVRKGRLESATERARLCEVAVRVLIADTVCFGYSTGGSGPVLDAQPMAVAARDRAASVFVKALAAPPNVRRLALDLLLEGTGSRASACTGQNDVVYQATGPLLAFLGAPTPKLAHPPDPDNPQNDRDRAFRLLSYGIADRTLAEARVRPFLVPPETLPLAALTLERMGADASAAVPRLENLLDSLRFDGEPMARHDATVLVKDTLELLIQLGPRANPALPALARLLTRSERIACRTFPVAYLLEVARTTSAPGGSNNSVLMLAPLVHCAGDTTAVVRALSEVGQAATGTLLAALRDETLSNPTRLESARVLRDVLGHPLSERERELMSTLAGRAGPH